MREEHVQTRVRFDLAELVRGVLDARRAEAGRRAVTLLAALAPATAIGDPRLTERLVADLVENAIRHNEDGGWAGVTVREDNGRAVLTVVNTGPPVPGERLSVLFMPYAGGSGPGLPAVRAVADAHRATIAVTARLDGGLVIEVAFPAR